MSNKRHIGIVTLAMINFAAVMSLRNLPFMSVCGMEMFFFYGIAAATFLLPTAFVSAELATAWPSGGGLYAWIKMAFGPKWGFIAIWTNTAISFVTFPAILAYMGGAIAYLVDPNLVNNRYFMFGLIVVCFWGLTLINLRGMQWSSIISSVGGALGTFLPALLLIVLGSYWFFSGQHTAMDVRFDVAHILPKFNVDTLVKLMSAMLPLAGIEMSAFHAREVHNPKRSYPLAILLSTFLIVSTLVLGSLAIAVIVPRDNIVLHAGVIQSFTTVLTAVHMSWLAPVVALLLAVGAMAMVSTWVAGPPRGLLEAAQTGILPPWLQRERNGMPVSILLVQAVVVTLFSAFFLLAPNANQSFWMLMVVATQLQLFVYVLLFLAALKLRVTHKDTARPFKIPGGIWGMGCVCGIGLLSVILSLLVGFIPPEEIRCSNMWQFIGLMIVGTTAILLPPVYFLLRYKRKIRPTVC